MPLPNHHVLIDKRAISIDDDLTVRDHSGSAIAQLTRDSDHPIDVGHLRYHRLLGGL